MVDWIEANWIVFGVAVLLVLLAAWLVWGRGNKAPARREYHDVLSEGAGPAQRNSALIDAPPAAAVAPPMPITPTPATGLMAGAGEVVAAAAEQEVEEAAALGDDLTKIKGLGPKLSTLLGQLGVTRYAQIAAWSDADLAAINAQLGSFAGRPVRDKWIEQARLLAGGDSAAYEAKFGKL